MRRLPALIALAFGSAAHSLDFAEFNAAGGAFDLKGHVHYYFEEYNEQQPHEALDLLKNGLFTRADSARLSLGYTRKAVWVAVPFVWREAKAATFMLEITALIDSIQFSYVSERGLILDSSLTGRDFPMSSRGLPNHNFVFPITIEKPTSPAPASARVKREAADAATRGVILMRLQSQGSMLVPLQLMHEVQFYKTDHIEQLVFGFYFGIMLVMVLYNLFLYASTRERSYAFYVFYILFFALFQFALWGYFHEIVLPDAPRLAKYLLPTFLHLATIFQLLFATQFFQAKALIARQYKLAGFLSFVTFLSLIVGPFLPYRIFITIGIFTGSGAAVAIFFMALKLYIRKVKVARYFLIAYTTLIGGVVFLTLRNLGVINYSFISTYSAQIGSALEVILLSLALADKINIWRNEKEEAQKQVIDREREMNRAFQLFVPQKFLELAGETDFTRLQLGKSTTRDITILFSDIRRFTALSESMTPEENFRFLNSYLSRMGPIIRKNGGFIDKFIGDAIMALFPVSPQTAAQAALAMRHELRLYNAHRRAQNFEPIDIGIGIHTGSVRLGTIGENERWEGTVIGDTVNLASRIENLSSTFSAAIVVSEAVLRELPPETPARELDTIRVKGKKQAVTVYELVEDEA
jgi:class 3 adenylate cyclase